MNNEKIRVARALIRLARILVAYKPHVRRHVSDRFTVGKKYRNYTGEFEHPTVYGFWGDVENATFTVTRTGLDWESGTWLKGNWQNGKWQGGTWNNGKWFDGTWSGGMWLGGMDGNGVHHKAGDSPDRWKKSQLRKRGDKYNPTLYDLFGEEGILDLDKDDRDLLDKIFGERASHSPYRDLTPEDIFGESQSGGSSSRLRDITPDDIFGDGKPNRNQTQPAEKPVVMTVPRRKGNREKWRLTRCSDNHSWEWQLPVGLGESEVMKRFESAIEECDHQRFRTTWDIFMDDDDKYSVRDDDDNMIYTFEKMQ